MHQAYSPVNHKVACEQCRIADMCLLHNQQPIEREELARIIARGRQLQRGQSLFDVGDYFQSLYVVQSGSVKVCVPMEREAEQVLGFYLPGDLVGFDGVGNERHNCTALALEHTSVCELPFEIFVTLSHSLPTLLRNFYRLIGVEMLNNKAMLMLLGRKNAEQRFAAFLLSYSMRYRKLGLSPHEFNLSMSRYDIANYLGLTSETVSRLCARFHKDGVMRVKGRFVKSIDVGRLRALMGEPTVGGDRVCGKTPVNTTAPQPSAAARRIRTTTVRICP